MFHNVEFYDVSMTFQFFPTNFDQLSTQLVPGRAPIRNFTVFGSKCKFFPSHLTNFIEIYQISSVFVENFAI